ncbi:hypothetical protein JCM21900_003431 [Sporobolomyces salmonicolor]
MTSAIADFLSPVVRRPASTYVPILAQPPDSSSSPQLKHEQYEWARRRHGILGRFSRLGSSNYHGGSDSTPASYPKPGCSRSHLRCIVLCVLPILALVTVLLGTSSKSGHAAALKSSLIGAAKTVWPDSRTQQAFKLRSPHHTLAFAEPQPNVRGAYEAHPIHTLIKEAKLLWKQKNERQSKTYDEADEEYRRRYGREPPDGFETWYYWAKENNVPLLDEYDSIANQVHPFLSLRPSELRRRVQAFDHDRPGGAHTVLHLENGKHAWSGAAWRPAVRESFDELLEGIAHMLPDMSIPFYLHDAAFVQIDSEAMEGYRLAAREGRWVNETELPIAGETMQVLWWTWRERTCPPDSQLRRSIAGLANEFLPPGPSFVRNHSREMSYCMNPDNLNLHGSTSGSIQLRRLEPCLALSRLGVDGDIVWPSTIQYNLNPDPELSFLDKPVHKIVWRGSPDGIHVAPEMRWRQSQRFRLLALAASNDTAPRLLRQTSLDRLGREYQLDTLTNLGELNARYTNIEATHGPVQCREDVCEYLRKTMKFVEKASLEEMSRHRYVMDVDGNAYSARFRTHLFSNQLPFKATIYEEWYSSRIQEWVHYVPVRVDYSDLYNLLAFFDGGLDASSRQGHHDALAEEIAMAGKEWAKTHWRWEDMRAYVFRLLLEYGRIMNLARER